MFYGQRIHDKCYRRGVLRRRPVRRDVGRRGRAQGWCLYKMGCRGPMTYNSCSTMKWNDGVSFPIGSGHGCIGCSENDFWDNGPFYDAALAIPCPASSRPDRIGTVAGLPARACRPHPRRRKAREARPLKRHGPSEGECGAWRTESSSIPSPASKGTCASRRCWTRRRRSRTRMSSGTMWRGLELILQGRDPRDAWAVHASASAACAPRCTRWPRVRAVENALGIKVPPQRRHHPQHHVPHASMVQDHVIHFYHLHALDWVDVVSALQGRPGATAALAQKVSPPLAEVDARLLHATCARHAEEVRRVRPARASSQNAYWGHPAYKLPPEANLMAVAHYLEALQAGRRRSSRSTRSSAARTRTRTTWWAAWPAPSTCRATTPSTSSASTMSRT